MNRRSGTTALAEDSETMSEPVLRNNEFSGINNQQVVLANNAANHESPWKTFLCTTSAFVAFTIATAVILFYFRRSPAVRSLVKFGTSAPGMGLRMACVEDGDCQDEANLVCGSDGFDRVCLCDSGYVEEGSDCSESPAQPGEPCDGRMRCAKRTNMVCDQLLKPPRCDCMAGTLWQEDKCVALFELTGNQEEERPQNTTAEDSEEPFTVVRNESTPQP
ncbi:uncharacterized protein [Dermacentor andersoni]|uniref:uncharacterized protein isoform X3 n=1 Tax=Dermacentor andersoni TaxID=34620 RepID=UPI0024168BFE|nr:uncharacterized protein LOC129386103 isoform X3 [Dermacentor andersoni]